MLKAAPSRLTLLALLFSAASPARAEGNSRWISIDSAIGPRLAVIQTPYQQTLESYMGRPVGRVALDLRLSAALEILPQLELGASLDYLFARTSHALDLPTVDFARRIDHHGWEVGGHARWIHRGRTFLVAMELAAGPQVTTAVMRGVTDTRTFFFIRPALSVGYTALPSRSADPFFILLSLGYAEAFGSDTLSSTMSGLVCHIGLRYSFAGAQGR